MTAPHGSNYPVYPQPALERGQIDQRKRSDKGLTLLDLFAKDALPVAQQRLQVVEPSYLNRPPIVRHATAAEVAAEAYDLAEAMLTESRERQKRYNAAEAAPQV